MKAICSYQKTWLTLLLLGSFTGIVWWQRKPMQAWYEVRQLTNAYEENREGCAKRVAALEEAALPGLLEGLHDPDALVCLNMQAALELILKKWGVQDPCCLDAIALMRARFDTFSLAGQEKTLLLLTSFLQQDNAKPRPAQLDLPLGELVLLSEKKDELRPVALLLAAELLDGPDPAPWVQACRALAERGLNDGLYGTRIAAVRLLLREPMRKEKALLGKVVPLLQDKEPTVRRVALLALASETELVSEDALLPLLQDEDVEVQYLCELALRKRGRTDDDIQLARLISDKNPATRLRVLHFLPRMPNLNHAEWLRQLSVDPAPAVRAAAIRAAGENPAVDFSERLREMAEQDTSDAVRMNAQFYLRQRVALRAMNDRR